MEKTLSSKILFKGRILTLRHDEVLLQNGRTAQRELILHPGAVAIVPALPPTSLLLIRQFRKALEKTIYEIPAGTLEPGEKIEDCAHRELEEEVGYRAKKLTKKVSYYPAPGYSNELIHIFLAEGLYPTQRKLESDEEIEPVVQTREEIKKLLRRGEIEDSKSLIGISIWLGLLD